MSGNVKCSKCGELSEVIVSRPVIDPEGGRLRRRLCRRCGHRWYSLQPELPPEQEIPAVFVAWQASDVAVNRQGLSAWRIRHSLKGAEARPAA